MHYGTDHKRNGCSQIPLLDQSTPKLTLPYRDRFAPPPKTVIIPKDVILTRAYVQEIINHMESGLTWARKIHDALPEDPKLQTRIVNNVLSKKGKQP